jgi:DNA mismatch repair protein MSH4
MLKNFVHAIKPIYDVLTSARSDLLATIRENCRPENIDQTIKLISEVINDDVTFQKTPLDLRNQRIYAVKVIMPAHIVTYLPDKIQSGVSGLLDVARQTFKEATEDVHQHVANINSRQNPGISCLVIESLLY